MFYVQRRTKSWIINADSCNLFNKKFEIAELAVFIIISELFYPQIAIIVTNLKHNSWNETCNVLAMWQTACNLSIQLY